MNVKPAAIILIIWATLTLFIDIGSWYGLETIFVKMVAILVLVHLASFEFEGSVKRGKDL